MGQWDGPGLGQSWATLAAGWCIHGWVGWRMDHLSSLLHGLSSSGRWFALIHIDVFLTVSHKSKLQCVSALKVALLMSVGQRKSHGNPESREREVDSTSWWENPQHHLSAAWMLGGQASYDLVYNLPWLAIDFFLFLQKWTEHRKGWELTICKHL